MTCHTDKVGMKDFWWLRSPSNLGSEASFVDFYDVVHENGVNVYDSDVAVNPAL